MTDRVSKGQMAGLINAEIRDRILKRESSILNRLISLSRSGQLSGEDAKGGIAAIAELRSILSDLDREIRQGQDELDAVMKGAPIHA